jgi:phosphate-selective porin OprO/OprP
MKTLRTKLLAGAAVAVALAAPPALAQQDLETRVKELEQEVQLLRKQLGAQVQRAQATADEAAAKAMDEGGVKVKMKGPAPTFESEDGRYTMSITGRIHWDAAFYDQEDNSQQVGGVISNPVIVPDLNSGTNLRRARLGVNGRVDEVWRYELVLDAGDSSAGDVQIDQIWLAYTGFDPLTLKLGRHKTPNGFDERTSSNDIPFIERSSANNLATGFGGGKRVGVSGVAHGDFWWAGLGVFGADWDEEADDEQLSVNGRLAFAPIRMDKEYALHIGASGYHVFEPNQGSSNTIRFRDRPNIRVDANRWVDAHTTFGDSAYMVGLEAAAQYRNFWINGEYNWFGFDETYNPHDSNSQRGSQDFNGYYVQAGWVMTGEPRPYSMSKAAWSGVKPDNPFSLDNMGWGAWELAFRYDHVDLNDNENSFASDGTFLGTRGGEQQTYTVGLNWWVNNYVAFKFNWIHVDVDRIVGPGGVCEEIPDSSCVLGVDTSAGDNFDVFGMRAQVKW